MNISVKYIATELHLPFSLDEQSNVAKDPVKVEGKAQGLFLQGKLPSLHWGKIASGNTYSVLHQSGQVQTLRNTLA